MNQSIHHLFVYGSLLSGFQHPAYAYISRYFTLVSKATANGHIYDIGEYPGAVPAPAPALINGELYVVNHSDEFSFAIKQLDDYEGFLVEPGEIPLFRRETVDVTHDNNSTSA
ncbi:gamma-glutamylcyclotransferase [Pseudoflavitalea sp. G-6-1-2]|uniref:gamma-glutamylcyclotransferase family protein n=1 Tax=Pseudoflavitalea sp. G-6-1-2 TaxID=2728841 RepID=UPI00146BC64A|nr:gamma-glutamylcyclotransferase family protein [Pseudoflavitalea sp. G-6-1-2]NML20367.1 gamma-glutamylcyclotransferase [Pseudoflavitalea sp. G-6-1-2]